MNKIAVASGLALTYILYDYYKDKVDKKTLVALAVIIPFIPPL